MSSYLRCSSPLSQYSHSWSESATTERDLRLNSLP